MIVTMELEDGSTVEAYFSTGERIPFGEWLDFEHDDGVTLRGRRIPTLSNASGVVCRNTSFASPQPPRWDPRAKRHTKDGWVAFDNRKEAREYLARVNADNERAGNGIEAKLD